MDLIEEVLGFNASHGVRVTSSGLVEVESVEKDLGTSIIFGFKALIGGHRGLGGSNSRWHVEA